MSPEAADPADLLRRHGVQVTAQRLAVMRAVSSRPHITADEVVEIVRAEIGATTMPLRDIITSELSDGLRALGVDFDEHIAVVIAALSDSAETLGLAGTSETVS